jgi:prepilin-type N-terminal cleavage/methylation domain-containing protein/prepilin-type processing-associated H-X9-DG protein
MKPLAEASSKAECGLDAFSQHYLDLRVMFARCFRINLQGQIFEANMNATRRFRRAFSLVELLVVVWIIAILIALLIPAVQKVRTAAANTQCVNNLRQIGLALHEHHDVRGYYPSALGEPALDGYGWMVSILPFIEREPLYKDFCSTDWNVFKDATATVIPLYLCPLDPRENAGGVGSYDGEANWSLALTSYLGVLGRTDTDFLSGIGNVEMMLRNGTDGGVFAILDQDGSFAHVKATQISDGLSTTLMVGERPPSRDNRWGFWTGLLWDNSLWAIVQASPVGDSTGDGLGTPCPAPTYFSPGGLDDFCHVNHFWSFHAGGANWLLCDGSVRFIEYRAGTTIIPDMASIAGGEVVPSLD